MEHTYHVSKKWYREGKYILIGIASELARRNVALVLIFVHDLWTEDFFSHLMDCRLREQTERLRDCNWRDTNIFGVTEVFHHDEFWRLLECKMLCWIELDCSLFPLCHILDDGLVFSFGHRGLRLNSDCRHLGGV